MAGLLPMSNVLDIKNAIYKMKRDYGVPAIFVRNIREETDTSKGIRYVVKETTQLPRIVIIPDDKKLKFFYDAAYLRNNSNFSYGGELPKTTKRVLLDVKLNPRLNDFIIYNNERYNIAEVVDLQFNLGYILILELSDGALPFKPVEIKVCQKIFLTGDILYASTA